MMLAPPSKPEHALIIRYQLHSTVHTKWIFIRPILIYCSLLCEWGDKSEQWFSTPCFLPQILSKIRYLVGIYATNSSKISWRTDTFSFHPSFRKCFVYASSYYTLSYFGFALGYLCVLHTYDRYLCYTLYFYSITANGLVLVFPIEPHSLPDCGILDSSYLSSKRLLRPP